MTTPKLIDSMNPAELSVFWANALTSYKVRPYSDAEIARLVAIGLTPEADPAVALDGDGPTLFFQKSVVRKPNATGFTSTSVAE